MLSRRGAVVALVVAAPVVAGLDKFFHLLVDWGKYQPDIANRLVGGHGQQLIPGDHDVALRDFGLSLAALALARLSAQYGERRS